MNRVLSTHVSVNHRMTVAWLDKAMHAGIPAVERIAYFAEAFHVPLAPHCTASYLGIAASLHVVASIPFCEAHTGA